MSVPAYRVDDETVLATIATFEETSTNLLGILADIRAARARSETTRRLYDQTKHNQ